MANDPRYYDLASRLEEAACDWYQVTDYLELWSLHPFEPFDRSETPLFDYLKNEIKIWDGPGKLADDSLTPEFFRVHVGAVEYMCQYLGLSRILGHDALMENLHKMTNPYDLPKLELSQEQQDKVLEECKRLSAEADKKTVKKESDRLRLIAQVIEMDQYIRKKFR